jgi:ATP-dependent helicase/nuclease subunit A
MSRSPNQEQLKAIQHQGGVILKAGAGSGKTFVLVQHVLYLIENYLNSFKEGDLRIELRHYLSKIVLMTFTNKAAGEITIRLRDMVKQRAQDSMEWKLVYEALDIMTITTIHGFCYKLISRGLIPPFKGEVEFLSETEYAAKIQELFDLWLDQTNISKDEIFYQLLIANQEQLVQSLKSIFSDPTLRSSWNEGILQFLEEDVIDEYIQEWIEEETNDHYLVDLDLSPCEENPKLKWSLFLKENYSFLNKKITTFKDLIKYFDFYESVGFKLPSKPTKKYDLPEIKVFFDQQRQLLNFLKANYENIKMFASDKEMIKEKIVPSFTELFNFIEEHFYYLRKGVTFSDLEYYVFKALQDQAVVSDIEKQFSYYIVDEYQDTSIIQFEILKQLVGQTNKKLFCVGDEKQAIYGFRGGELKVFEETSQMLKVEQMGHNYRSLGNIIEFNNIFYKNLFPLGTGYQNKDKHSVAVDPQTVPLEERKEKGTITELYYSGDGEVEFNTDELEKLESQIILEDIKAKWSETKNICILYKKLKASKELISLLMKNNIGFTAQVKVSYQDDPVLGIFDQALRWSLDKSEKRDDIHSFIICGYLSLMGVQIEHHQAAKALLQFKKDLTSVTVIQAFYRFLAFFGVRNSNLENNFNILKSINQFCKGDIHKIFSALNKDKKTTYSLDFQYGSESSKVQIMTVHASKGLQFDHVILGGIYTNALSRTSTEMYGKIPGSFQWANTENLNKLYKTPHYLYEKVLSKLKDFSESKRLLYVATTRAENSLSFVKLENVKHREQKNSWANALKSVPDIHHLLVRQHIEIDFSYSENTFSSKPLFQMNNMGLELHESYRLGLAPELSVTSLSSISLCPRKFYLQQVLKINEEDLNLFGVEKRTATKTGVSSADRGIRIHSLLENIIKSQKFESTAPEIKKIVDKLKNYREKYQFISEKLIKFNFFSFTMTAIPDLVLLPNSDDLVLEVWDYKTGLQDPQQEIAYNFQLLSYAYAYWLNGYWSKSKPIKTVIYYVDEGKMTDKLCQFEDVEKILFQYWSRTSTPDQMNHEHCESCPYREVCH